MGSVPSGCGANWAMLRCQLQVCGTEAFSLRHVWPNLHSQRHLRTTKGWE